MSSRSCLSLIHILDIKPLATQLVLNSISDSFMILSDNGLIISFNRPFSDIFTQRYGLKEGSHLSEFVTEDDNSSNAVVYNLITAVDSCKSSLSPISYEQSIITREDQNVYKAYFIVEVSPVLLKQRLSGYVVIFKDVTQLKNSMQKQMCIRDRGLQMVDLRQGVDNGGQAVLIVLDGAHLEYGFHTGFHQELQLSLIHILMSWEAMASKRIRRRLESGSCSWLCACKMP